MLVAESLTMRFGSVTVLEDASVTLHPGEVHAFVGENGAGKSTLAKIIGGVYRPTRGTLTLNNHPITLPHPRAALTQGIALIHQEPMTFPDLTIAENIFVGRQPLKNGRVDWQKMQTEAAHWLQSLGSTLSPRQLARGLSVADRQMMELASALSQNARVLLLDETTASLTPTEVERLFGILRRLTSEGVALAFIGHRMEEIFAITNQITILRDGRIVGRKRTSETSVDEVLGLMVGREMASPPPRPESTLGSPALTVRNLRTARFPGESVGFTIHSGEIVGVAGLVGAGRTDIARALFGLDTCHVEEIRVGEQTVSVRSPQEAMRHGIALVPEDRQKDGTLGALSIVANATLPFLQKFVRGWVRDTAAVREAEEIADAMTVKRQSVLQPIAELSGGNQQKVVLGRWLQTQPKVLILDEPTRGIDVGAKAEVYRIITEKAAEGRAVLLISSDLPEVLSLSDRILTLRAGRVVAEFAREDATPERVLAAMAGVAP
jgi:rhamnose transport system ATP-binding protein